MLLLILLGARAAYAWVMLFFFGRSIARGDFEARPSAARSVPVEADWAAVPDTPRQKTHTPREDPALQPELPPQIESPSTGNGTNHNNSLAGAGAKKSPKVMDVEGKREEGTKFHYVNPDDVRAR